MRTFVIGDIHGAYKPLKKCLKKARFNLKEDRLICLGDVCDRGKNVKKAIKFLLRIKNLIYILGNHDQLTIEWAESGIITETWVSQGGKETIKSYPHGIPKSHLNFLKTANPYYIENDKLFIHGGIRRDIPIEEQNENVFLWDRSLVNEAIKRKKVKNSSPVTKYNEVYVGHTPTQNFGSKRPINACEVWLMDTGAGWYKKLSLMNINTKEIFQCKIK